MSEIQVYFRISIKDWGMIDNCLNFVIYALKDIPKLSGKTLSSKDEYFLKWLENIEANIKEQVVESTQNADLQELNKALDMNNEILPEFVGVIKDAQLMLFNNMLDKLAQAQKDR